ADEACITSYFYLIILLDLRDSPSKVDLMSCRWCFPRHLYYNKIRCVNFYPTDLQFFYAYDFRARPKSAPLPDSYRCSADQEYNLAMTNLRLHCPHQKYSVHNPQYLPPAKLAYIADSYEQYASLHE